MHGALRVPVQIVFQSGHTSGSYVTEEGWHEASIERCPKCGRAIRGHGTYPRKFPDGTRIARFYCRSCQMTVSLLPEFLAAGYSDTLGVQRAAVDAVNSHPTFDAAAAFVRPDIQLQGARRWLRRRVQRHHMTMLLMATMLGLSTDNVEPFELRRTRPEILRHAPTPTGLAHRPLKYWSTKAPRQQPMGPDPPA